MMDIDTAQKALARTPDNLFTQAAHDAKHMPKPDMERVDALHAQLAPLVDSFKPTDEELLAVLATFLWTMPYTKEKS